VIKQLLRFDEKRFAGHAQGVMYAREYIWQGYGQDAGYSFPDYGLDV
jgi:hypothetical protein